MARLEAHLGANILIEPSQKSSQEEEPVVWATAIDDQEPEPWEKQGLCKQWAAGQRVQRVAAAAGNGWDRQALRRDQLVDNNVGPLMRELVAGQCPKWRDVSDQGPIYKTYCAQWKSLAVRDGMLECHWESGNRKKKMAQIATPTTRWRKYWWRCTEAYLGDIWN